MNLSTTTTHTRRDVVRRAVLTAIASAAIVGAAFATVGAMAHAATPDMSYQGSTAASGSDGDFGPTTHAVGR